MSHTPTEIKYDQVVVKEKNSGEEFSKHYTSKYTAATKALKPGFGAAKHVVLGKIARKLMLITPITPALENLFAAT